MNFSRFKKLLFLHLQHLPMRSRGHRSYLVKIGGVNIKDYKHTFVGENVIFDTNYPEDITIETGTTIALGCVFITHFVEVQDNNHRFYSRGKIHVSKNVYIGCNTIICKPITIGENAIIGAGSVITKDIPANEIWAGNPAKFIKKRE